jgi:hypothetical protein
MMLVMNNRKMEKGTSLAWPLNLRGNGQGHGSSLTSQGWMEGGIEIPWGECENIPREMPPSESDSVDG